MMSMTTNPTTRLGGKDPKDREKEARRYEASGLVVPFDDLEVVDKPVGITVYEFDGRLLTPMDPMGAGKVRAVVLSDDGSEVAFKLRRLTGAELDQIDDNEVRAEAGKVLAAQVNEEWQRVLKTAPFVPITRPASQGTSGAATLTNLERLTADAGAKLKLVRDGAAVLVLAPEPGFVMADAGAVIGDGSSGFETRMLGRGRKHQAACEALLRCVIDLDTLAVAYVANGNKPPKADHGKGLADRIVGGVWLA